ncbi:hypothetical protein C7999DRAFT_13637, partial [Corynascus novoguineensis]
VGVPGKYKGCETCRLRRVKCDNQRPHCRKCIDSGRTCAGYERETVFIIGTLDDRGRCSSHPPRVVNRGASSTPSPGAAATRSSSTNNKKAARSRSSTPASVQKRIGGTGSAAGAGVSGGDVRGEDEDGVEIVLDGRPKPAWDNHVDVECCRPRQHHGKYAVQVAGLRTVLARVASENGVGGVYVSLPACEGSDIQPRVRGEEFQLASRCLVHLAPKSDEWQGGTDSVCLFLYEDNNSSYFVNQQYWENPSIQANDVRRLGPEPFRSFPAHHFLARVYRPNAIMTALLNRTPTFLAEPQWLSTPFEIHFKDALDRLFDSLAVLASLLTRADHILAQKPTLARRLMAQDLLNNCLDLETEMAMWYTSLQMLPLPGSTSGGAGQPLFWFSCPTTTEAYSRPDPLRFKDNHTALALCYYWTALVLFYPTVWRVYFAAVIDAVVVMDDTTTNLPYSLPEQLHGYEQHHHHHHHTQQQQQEQQQQQQQQQMLPTTPSILTPLPIPSRLQDLDPMRYSLPQVREIAGNACRALDFLLTSDNNVSISNDGNKPPSPRGWTLLDLLWHPLFILSRFYRELRGIIPTETGGVFQPGMGMEMGLMEVIGGEGRLMEELWCDGLRERLLAGVQEMKGFVEGKRWVDAGAF